MATEETLVLVKPDGVARGLTGAILARIEAKGYALVAVALIFGGMWAYAPIKGASLDSRNAQLAAEAENVNGD